MQLKPRANANAEVDQWLREGRTILAETLRARGKHAEAEAMASLKRSMITTVLTGLGLMALVGAGAAWMVRRTVRPIRDTATAMEDIARGKGDLTRRLAVTTDDEVGELADLEASDTIGNAHDLRPSQRVQAQQPASRVCCVC